MHPFLPKLWNKIKVAFNVAIDVSTVVIDQVAGIPIVEACSGALGGLAGNVLGELISNMPENFLQARRERRARLKRGAKVYEDLASGKMFSTDNCPFETELDKIDFFAQAHIVFDECEKAYEEWEAGAKRRKKQEKRHEREVRRAKKKGQLPPPIPVNDESEIEMPDIPLSGSDGKALIALFTDYMYKENIEKYLNLSKLYSEKMVQQDKELLLEMLNGARESFLRSCYASDLDQGQQVLLSLFREILDKDLGDRFEGLMEMLEDKMAGFVCGYEGVSEERLEEMFEGAIERAISTRLAHMGADSGGEISLSEISSGAFSPKFLARKCPDCSYSGERLYFNEASGEFHCSACGLTYSVMKGIEEEAKILGCLDALKTQVTEAIATTVEHLNALEERTDEIGEDVSDIHDMATQLVETVATQEFLQKCMNVQGERIEGSIIQARNQIGEMITAISSGIKELVIQKVDELSSKLDETGDRLVSVVEGECAKLHAQNVTIMASLNTIGEQMAQMYNEILSIGKKASDNRDQIIEYMQGKFDILLHTVSTLTERVAELESTGPRAICFSQEQMCTMLSETETAITNPENGNVRLAFAALISGVQEELVEIRKKLGGFGTEIHNFLPHDMRLDGGNVIKEFACPYCGFVEARSELNLRADRCACSACGQEYFRINPNASYKGRPISSYDEAFWASLKPNSVKEIAELMSMAKDIKEWRAKHEARLLRRNSNGAYSIFLPKSTDASSKLFLISIDKHWVMEGGSKAPSTGCVTKISSILAEHCDAPPFEEGTTYIFFSDRGTTIEIAECDFIKSCTANHYKVYTPTKKVK